MIRVAFEATALLGPRSGVGEFVYGALSGLVDDDFAVDAFAVSWRRRGLLFDQLPASVGFIDRPLPARPLMMAWRHGAFPSSELLIGRYDVVHGSNFVAPPSRKARSIVTVHDMTPVRFPQMCQKEVLTYPDYIRATLRRGGYIHTPSQAVREEVIDYFQVEPERVFHVSHGIPTALYRDIDDPSDAMTTISELVSRGTRILLSVGTIEPRKNYPQLLEAFDELAEELHDVCLVIAGKRGWGSEAFDEKLATIVSHARVIPLGQVSEGDRRWLYSKASVFVYPSLYEGFGLPPLEAMREGIPVVAADVAALKEVLGGAALFVPPQDSGALAQAMFDVLDQPELSKQLESRGRERSAQFTWKKTGEGLRAMYRAVLA